MTEKKRKPIQQQVDALTRKVSRLEKLVKDLDERRHRELTSACGFEVDVVEADDDSEY